MLQPLSQQVTEYSYSAFLIELNSYANTFEKEAKKGQDPKIPLRIVELTSRKYGIAIISIESGLINYISLIQRIPAEISGGYIFSFSHCRKIQPINIEKILFDTGIKQDLFKPAKDSPDSNFGRNLVYEQWQILMNKMINLSPLDRSSIIDIDNMCKQLQNDNYEDGLDIMLFERDSIGLALEFAGFGKDRPSLLSRIPYRPKSLQSPILSFRNVPIIEDDLIIRDMQVFPNWLKIDQEHIINAVEFEKRDHRLMIINANRNNIEKNIGVDLIYFHQKFNSFVMIQYKKLKQEGSLKKNRRYRFNDDKNYESELERMNRFKDHLLLNSPVNSPDDFRLNNEAFYFKLCDPSDHNLTSQDLVQGSYFPLSYWKIIVKSDLSTGSQGGKVIEPAKMRYINNTLFIQLVQGSWVGSVSPKNISVIDELIQESLEKGHSVNLAIKKSSEDYTGQKSLDLGV